jgi:hypothetical protein
MKNDWGRDSFTTGGSEPERLYAWACGPSHTQHRPDCQRRHDVREFHFQPGPIFGNLILAAEINRAPAKAQAAVCQRPGRFVVPAARLTWWDLDHHQLRRVDFPARTFEVAANPALPRSPTASASSESRNLGARMISLGAVAAFIVVLAGFGLWKAGAGPNFGGPSASGVQSIWRRSTQMRDLIRHG